MGRVATGLKWGLAGVGLSLALTASANAAPAPASNSCDIHIWQRGIYKTEAHSALGSFGLLGAVLQAEYDRKYPADSIEGLIEDVLNIEALPATIAAVPWRDYTGAAENSLVFERAPLTYDQFQAVMASSARNSASQASCYIEIYVGPQTFKGGSLKSHLFSDFTVRTFYDGAPGQKHAILFQQTRRLSVKDAESLAAAKKTIADGFVGTLNKFLAKKLPRRNTAG